MFHTKFNRNQMINKDYKILGLGWGWGGNGTPICEHIQFNPNFQLTMKQRCFIQNFIKTG